MVVKFQILLFSLLSFSIPVQADDEAMTVTIKRLTADTALLIAQATMAECRKRGIQIGVAVIDRSGHIQVAMRDTLASDLTLRVAPQKAYTALSFNSPTSLLDGSANSPLNKMDGVLVVGGGLPIQAGGKILGAVGVSGAATGAVDEECAAAGIEAVIDDLEMEF